MSYVASKCHLFSANSTRWNAVHSLNLRHLRNLRNLRHRSGTEAPFGVVWNPLQPCDAPFRPGQRGLVRFSARSAVRSCGAIQDYYSNMDYPYDYGYDDYDDDYDCEHDDTTTMSIAIIIGFIDRKVAE